jgi:hypothetical protein
LFCFTGNYKKDLSETGRKQTIQRSSTGSTQSADFSKIIKTKSGRVLVLVRIIKNTRKDTVIAAYQLYKSRAARRGN